MGTGSARKAALLVLLMALTGLAIGIVVGIGASHNAQMIQGVRDVDGFLYDPEQQVDRDVDSGIARAEVLHGVIQAIATDYRARPEISSKRKLLILYAVRRSVPVGEISQWLALGASQDKDSKVRREYTEILAEWQAGLVSAQHMIERGMKLEADADVKALKQTFVQTIGTGDN